MADSGEFVRADRTWLAYGALASYAYCLYALGPILAFLHAELHLSYIATSLHSVLWAAGAIATGVAYPRLSQRLGRRCVFWGAAACLSLSALLFAGGYSLAATLLAASMLGIGGTVVLTATTAILSDEHGLRRGRALLEANVGASAVAVMAPAVIAGLDLTTLGWRAGMVVPIAALGVLWFRYRPLQLPSSQPPTARVRVGRLPVQFWLYATLAAIAGGIEFCLVFYAALLLHGHAGLSLRRAASALSVFYIGELVGRILGSRLARTAGRVRSIIAIALAVTIVGFAVFWLMRRPWLAVAGLGVAGLGIANLYPLSLAQAVGIAPGRTDQAAGRAQLAIGTAGLTMPFALGALANWVGIMDAYLLEPLLIGVAVILLFATRPSAHCLDQRSPGSEVESVK